MNEEDVTMADIIDDKPDFYFTHVEKDDIYYNLFISGGFLFYLSPVSTGDIVWVIENGLLDQEFDEALYKLEYGQDSWNALQEVLKVCRDYQSKPWENGKC